MAEVKQVYAAIAAVSSELAAQGISKDQRNSHQNYAFRGIDDVLDALAPLLSKHHLCIVPRVVQYECREGVTKKGDPNFHVFVEVEYDIVCALDGSIHPARMVGEAMDSQDKAGNKAVSAAYKYLAFQLFCIPVHVEDADASTPNPAASSQAHSAAATPKLATEEQVLALQDWFAWDGLDADVKEGLAKTLSKAEKGQLTELSAKNTIDKLATKYVSQDK